MQKIERTIDELGRIVLPKEFRAELGWEINDKILVTITETGLFLEKDKE